MTWLNDWPIKRCLFLSLCTSFLMAILCALMLSGISIPVATQIVGFTFLSIIPGTLVLRILKVHNINLIEGMAYSIGLSLATIMFFGALLNSIMPLMNVARPFSLLPLSSSLIILVLILSLIAFFRDRNYQPAAQTGGNRIDIKIIPVLVLAILLLMFIFGVMVNNAFRANLFIQIGIIFICVIIVLAAFCKIITPEVYPLALYVISLCLLYQTTLMSPYLIGTDIYTEYAVYHQVASAGIWDPSLTSIVNPNVNSCLSIAMLAPTYSLLGNISGIWVFKAVYPLIFSFLPLVLYRIFRIQLGYKSAFLSVIFFMLLPTFSLEMISLCRQQIAELFLLY